MPVEVHQSDRQRRTRQASEPFKGLPPLRPAQEALLKRWLASHAAERRWQSLLETAGREQLNLADELLAALLEVGALRVKERFTGGQWQVERVAWSDVPTLQAALGLRSAAERESERDTVQRALQALGEAHTWAESAAHSCLKAPLPLSSLQARCSLLESLAQWQQEQRFGLRRDFALQARGHTKSITNTEWDWLAMHVPLESLGIARFAPLLWLGGSLGLVTPGGNIDAAAAGFCAIPAQALDTARVTRAPERYMLIENRASFERQATAAAPGDCTIWLPGQPPTDWLAAVGRLLDLAPAPALVSCDPDPAGVTIALHAGALWSERNLAWSPHRMAFVDWAAAPATSLNEFDHQRLAQLQARKDLPQELAQLCNDLRATGRKAEQEGWL